MALSRVRTVDPGRCSRESASLSSLIGARVCGVVRKSGPKYIALTVTALYLRTGRTLKRGEDLEAYLVCASRKYASRIGWTVDTPKSWLRVGDDGMQLGPHVSLVRAHGISSRNVCCLRVDAILKGESRKGQVIALELSAGASDEDADDDPWSLHMTAASSH